MSSTSKLRWALYEDVYQPALIFPPEELLEADLPPGHTVVYLLGLDSNVVVPDDSVSDYNPRDTAKMSNPAAAVGVALAQQIMEGFQNSSTGDDDVAAAAGTHSNGNARYNAEGDNNVAGTSDLHLLDDDDGLSEEEEEDAAEARRRRHEQKKLRKAEKKQAKEAAKAAVKREREDITSAPTLRRRAASDNDEEDENESDALLAAMAIEKKYGSAKVKAEKANDAEGDHDGSQQRRRRGPTEEATWAALEEDLFSDDDEEEEGNGTAELRRRAAADHHRSLRSGNRMGQALAALNAKTALHDIPGLTGACPYAQPYLMEIHYEYEQLTREAVNEGLLLSLQESEVIRAIDEDLRQKAAQRAFLEAAVRTRQHNASSATTISEMDALHDAITKLDAPLSVVDAVRRLVTKQMPARAIAFDRVAAGRARRAVQRRTRTFQDATVVTLVEHLRNVDAAPREDGAEVMRRYIAQRRQHDELKSNFRGLSKTGFYAVAKPLEKWRRARDMMVLANVGAEAQKVLPTSYMSQAHSTMLRRMKEHAERRYDRVAVTARDGASFLDASSFASGSAIAAAPSPSPLMGNGTALTLQQALQQQRLAASNATTQREAFFQFHALRCDTETPVTLETVALNPVLAGAGLSQNVLASVEDMTASAAPAGGHVDDSVRTDDGASVHSYSTHSAAPSSYAYIFDSEPHPRRVHRQRGGNLSGGYTSDGDGASSRGASVGSAYSESNHHNDGEGNDGAREKDTSASYPRRHHRREPTAKASAHNGSAANATADWRTNAKRSIMEQLTLYCRGRGGKPVLLTADQCREIGRTLLDRAMRAEAERNGVSLAVQSNNLAAPFTKTTEQRLKKSVDNYLERRLAQKTLPGMGAGGIANGGAGGVLDGAVLHGNSVGAVLPMPGEAVLPYDQAAAARQRAVADTPVYEN